MHPFSCISVQHNNEITFFSLHGIPFKDSQTEMMTLTPFLLMSHGFQTH